MKRVAPGCYNVSSTAGQGGGALYIDYRVIVKGNRYRLEYITYIHSVSCICSYRDAVQQKETRIARNTRVKWFFASPNRRAVTGLTIDQ